MLPALDEVFEASDADHYALLAVDMGLDTSGRAYLLGCSNAPNFHVGANLEQSLVVPLFAALLSALVGENDSNLSKLA